MDWTWTVPHTQEMFLSSSCSCLFSLTVGVCACSWRQSACWHPHLFHQINNSESGPVHSDRWGSANYFIRPISPVHTKLFLNTKSFLPVACEQETMWRYKHWLTFSFLPCIWQVFIMIIEHFSNTLFKGVSTRLTWHHHRHEGGFISVYDCCH